MNFEDSFIGRPNTIRVYKSLFQTHIKPTVTLPENWSGARNFITPYIQKWQEEGLSISTISTLVRLLAKFVEFNGGPKLETKHYVSGLQRLEQEKELLVLNHADAEKLMLTCKDICRHFYPTLLLGLHAGLRRGEVYGLNNEDIDLLKGRIKVCRSYNGPTKNGRTRFVPMSAELVSALSNRSLGPIGNRLFKLENPNPRLRWVCRSSGVKELRFHDLRHTFATLALEAGTSPKQVQVWLGHSSLTTTLKTYWNLIEEEASLTFLPGGTNE